MAMSDPEDQPARDGELLLERCALLQRLRTGLRAQTALDHADRRHVDARPQPPFRQDAPSQAGSEYSMLPSVHFGAHPVTCSTPATIATMASEIGRNTFQPSRINWS